MNVDDWDGTGRLPTLYTRTATGAVNVWSCWVMGASVMTEWGQQDGTLQRSQFSCLPKNEGRSNATTAEQQAIKEAIAQWKKKRKRKYSEQIEGFAEVHSVRPMLALDFPDHKHKLVYPVTVQPKLNGVRCLAHYGKDGIILQSRGNEVYELPHISTVLQDMLPADAILDGELYVHGVSLQNILSLVRRPREESQQVLYCVYDVIDKTVPGMRWAGGGPELITRRSWLSWFFHNYGPMLPGIWPVPYAEATSEEQIRALQKELVAQGYEGAMIRAHDATYRGGYRSPGLLKLKDWKTDEFRIVRWTVGRGKFENVPVFTCVTAEGQEFDASPEGSMADRAEMLREADSYIGKMMTVRYFDWSDDRKPLFTTALGLREPSDMS